MCRSERCKSLWELTTEIFLVLYNNQGGFPGGSDGKDLAYDAKIPGFEPGSGRSQGEGNGNPLQYSCLKNPLDKGVILQPRPEKAVWIIRCCCRNWLLRNQATLKSVGELRFITLVAQRSQHSKLWAPTVGVQFIYRIPIPGLHSISSIGYLRHTGWGWGGGGGTAWPLHRQAWLSKITGTG